MWMGHGGSWAWEWEWAMEDESGRKGSVGEPWAWGNGYSKRWAPRSKGVPMICGREGERGGGVAGDLCGTDLAGRAGGEAEARVGVGGVRGGGPVEVDLGRGRGTGAGVGLVGVTGKEHCMGAALDEEIRKGDQHGRDIYRPALSCPPCRSCSQTLAPVLFRTADIPTSSRLRIRPSLHPTMSDQPPRGLVALWLAFLAFLATLFTRSPNPAPLPIPVTARPPKAKPTPASVRVPWVKEPTPLNRTTSSPISSTARTSPACRSRSATPKHPPASPFPHISLSGIFATPPLPDLGLSLAPSPSHGPSSPSFHTLHSTSPSTPSSAVLVRPDRSPTTMSDGSLEVISLGDRRGFPGSPVKLADIARLPSPWSPIGKMASSDVWVDVDGMLMNATGPVDIPTQSRDDSAASRTALHSLSRISSASLYSSHSALDAFGISVFANLDEGLSSHVDAKEDRSIILKPHDESRPTPRKRRDTLPFVTPHTPNHSARATKHLSTPLAKLGNVDLGHVRSATSISSMAYELRMGLFADGRSMTGFENILSLLDQASPESIPPYNDAMRPVEAG